MFLTEVYLCAISLSSLVSTLASDVIPATLHAMSLQGNGKMEDKCQNSDFSSLYIS